MATEKPLRSATPGSLLSQWWSLGALTRDKRARTRHFRAAWVILDRYMQGRGKGRASVRYIAKATGLAQRAVVSACRELTEWGYTQRIVGSGSRPSEYMPNWVTTPPSIASHRENGAVSGTHWGSTIATHAGHANLVSDTHGCSESDLNITGVEAELCVSEEVSTTAAHGPSAAPVVGMGFERIWRAYGKYGNKAASKRAFEAIANPDVDHIAERVAAWAASAKPGQRRMPLEKWLEQERYDEADRSVKPHAPRAAALEEGPDEEDADVRRKRDSVDAASAAEAAYRVQRAAVDIRAPANMPLTVLDSAAETRGADTWLALKTDGGDVAVLVEGGSGKVAEQEAGQAHLMRLADACGLSEIIDGSEFHGRTFMIAHGSFVRPSQEST